MAGINHDVINIRIKNQECRQALSCVSDPLHDILKKKEKKTHEHFLSGLEKRSSTDYFSPDKTSTAESAAVATKSYGYTEEFDDYTTASSKDSSKELAVVCNAKFANFCNILGRDLVI